jgi:hypothetical protein
MIICVRFPLIMTYRPKCFGHINVVQVAVTQRNQIMYGV